MIVKEYRVDFKKPLKPSYLQRFWFKKKVFFGWEFSVGQKNDFFRIFLNFLKSPYQDETFCVFTKISYLQWFWFKIKHVFRLIISNRPKKLLFSDFSCFFEIVTSRRIFLVFTKISYLQLFWFKKNVFFG